MNGTTGGGKLFSRRAYVGLKSETWGQLQAGRNLFIDSDGVCGFDPFVQQAVSSASLVRGRNWQRTSNNVEYHSPVFHGIDVQGQSAFGNQASGFNNGAEGEFGRSDSIMLTYHSPLFDVRSIYDGLRDSSGRFSNIFTASREYFVGADVRAQKFKIQAAYTHYAAPDSPAGVTDSADHYWLGATYQATPRWAATAGDNYLRAFDVTNGEQLWQARLPAGGHATPMSYSINGRQYVVIAAGGHGSFSTKLGDYVIAYALPQR